MVDALYWEIGRKLVPMRSFVRMDGRTCGNDFFAKATPAASGFSTVVSVRPLVRELQRRPAVCRSDFQQGGDPCDLPCGFPGERDRRISAIEFNVALQSTFIASEFNGLANFMKQNEARLVIASRGREKAEARNIPSPRS